MAFQANNFPKNFHFEWVLFSSTKQQWFHNLISLEIIIKSYKPIFFYSSIYSGFRSIVYLGGIKSSPSQLSQLHRLFCAVCCLVKCCFLFFFSGAQRRKKHILKPEKVLTVFMQRCQMINVLGETDGGSFISAMFHLLKQQRTWPKGKSVISCLIDICSPTIEKCFYLSCAIITGHQKAKKALNYTWLVAGVWYFNATCSIVACFCVLS